MRAIGFSTGAIAYGNFRTALEILGAFSLKAVELSALREDEVIPLLDALPSLNLSEYSYLSIHVPSSYDLSREEELIDRLAELVPDEWPVILHPDAAGDLKAWGRLGRRLTIENMDRRKTDGRTASELRAIFGAVPEAGLCLDVGHARQVDNTMIEALQILREFGSRLTELHVSEVDTLGKHHRLSASGISSFQQLADLIPEDIPLILESPVDVEEIHAEVEAAQSAFSVPPLRRAVG